MSERRKGRTQQQVAVRANIASTKTVRKYERLGKLPSELKQPRCYRTRPDAFGQDWPEVERMLTETPELEAKTLFEWLCECCPGRYSESQLRTFQRRVSDWRAVHEQKLLSLEQVHQPGEVMQTDGTCMNDLGITIAGEPFAHLVMHCVLPYSNWEWGRVVQSESLLSLRLGVQSALGKLGAVPRVHQTDNTTAATHDLRPGKSVESVSRRGFNHEYVQLMAHYGMEPRSTHRRRPDENGDVESANGWLKRAVEQHLLLRGSRDFASLDSYEEFLQGIFERRNASRQQKLAEELRQMRPLTVAPWPARRELSVRVSRNGMIRVWNNGYSVSSGLVGKRVRVRVYEWQVEVWYANRCVDRFPRLTGVGHNQVNYRHVVDTLLRKPGGFRAYRFRDCLFPRAVFRRAWEALERRLAPRQADASYLRILKLAAKGMETDVAAALESLLASGGDWDETTVSELVGPGETAVPQLEQQRIDLGAYDQLLGREGKHVAA